MTPRKPARRVLLLPYIGIALVAAGILTDRKLLTVAGLAVNACYFALMWRPK